MKQEVKEGVLYILCPYCFELESVDTADWDIESCPSSFALSYYGNTLFATEHYSCDDKGIMKHLTCGSEFVVENILEFLLLYENEILYLGPYWLKNKQSLDGIINLPVKKIESLGNRIMVEWD